MSPLKPMSKGQREVYEILKAAGDRGITTSEFLSSRCGSRYSARILELRAKFGCQISTERLSQGNYRFRLLSAPSPSMDRYEAIRDEYEQGGLLS